MGLPGLRALLVCVLVAGTAAGTLPSDSRFAGDSPTGLTVEGDPGGVDAQRAYGRLAALYDRDLPALAARFHRSDGVDLRETHPDPFFGLLADPAIRIQRPVRGAPTADGVAVSYRNGTPPGVVERVFVHEVAHALEPRSPRLDAASAVEDTTDARLARQALTEGAATFVADVYAERHLDVLTQSARIALAWPTMTDATRLLWAPYRYGAAHVHARIASPARLGVVYADPPRSTEQVLHPFRADAGPRGLAVEADDPVAGFEPASTDTKGELYLRVLLESELDPDRAARAAAGWGDDRLVTYADGDELSFAWVLRWDSRGDAREFEAAVADYLNATATRRGAGWTDGEAAFRLDCVSGETCTLLAGDSDFVRTARVSENKSGVAVS